MNRDFSVNLSGMITLIENTGELCDLLWEPDVEDFLPMGVSLNSASDEAERTGLYGTSDVVEALSEFSSRWDLGLNQMKADLQEIQGRLAGVTQAYSGLLEVMSKELQSLERTMERLGKSSAFINRDF